MSETDRYTLETPENIELDYEPAGIGTRFCAMLIDYLVLAVILLLLLLPFAVIGLSLPNPLAHRNLGMWVVATLVAVVSALVSGGYFLLVEYLMRGQTPGKRAMKIRVIRSDGTPVTGNEILVRNILRMVDFLPFGYALGTIVMFPNRLSQRLGDLAAGTLVVKEGALDYRAKADEKASTLRPAPVAVENAELTADERRMLTGFLHRRLELLPQARADLAARLAQPLFQKYGGVYGSAESYLERLVNGRHYEP